MRKEVEHLSDYQYWSEINSNPDSPSFLFMQVLADNDWPIIIAEGPEQELAPVEEGRPKTLPIYVKGSYFASLSRICNYGKAKEEYRNLDEEYFNRSRNGVDKDEKLNILQKVYQETIEEHPDLKPSLKLYSA